MGILILKTNIMDAGALSVVRPKLDRHPAIRRWSVDTEDIDKVLRIETSEPLSIEEVIVLVRSPQIQCEELVS